MILYKYVSLESGIKILEGNSIGFSEPQDFNDPFETAARDKAKESGLKPVFSSLNNCRNLWARNVAVLSLTRQPKNKLMLAHYSDNHKGMVIGFDLSKIQDFLSEEFCYIPAQYGSVIYTDTMPTFNAQEDDSANWEVCSYEIRQRALLHKDITWSMEEEVRIALILRDYETRFDVIQIDDRPLYLFKLPEDAICEVYLGPRAEILPANFGNYETWVKLSSLLNARAGCTPYQLVIDDNSWNIEAERLHTNVYDGYWELHHNRLKCD